MRQTTAERRGGSGASRLQDCCKEEGDTAPNSPRDHGKSRRLNKFVSRIVLALTGLLLLGVLVPVVRSPGEGGLPAVQPNRNSAASAAVATSKAEREAQEDDVRVATPDAVVSDRGRSMNDKTTAPDEIQVAQDDEKLASQPNMRAKSEIESDPDEVRVGQDEIGVAAESGADSSNGGPGSTRVPSSTVTSDPDEVQVAPAAASERLDSLPDASSTSADPDEVRVGQEESSVAKKADTLTTVAFGTTRVPAQVPDGSASAVHAEASRDTVEGNQEHVASTGASAGQLPGLNAEYAGAEELPTRPAVTIPPAVASSPVAATSAEEAIKLEGVVKSEAAGGINHDVASPSLPPSARTVLLEKDLRIKELEQQLELAKQASRASADVKKEPAMASATSLPALQKSASASDVAPKLNPAIGEFHAEQQEKSVAVPPSAASSTLPAPSAPATLMSTTTSAQGGDAAKIGEMHTEVKVESGSSAASLTTRPADGAGSSSEVVGEMHAEARADQSPAAPQQSASGSTTALVALGAVAQPARPGEEGGVQVDSGEISSESASAPSSTTASVAQGDAAEPARPSEEGSVKVDNGESSLESTSAPSSTTVLGVAAEPARPSEEGSVKVDNGDVSLESASASSSTTALVATGAVTQPSRPSEEGVVKVDNGEAAPDSTTTRVDPGAVAQPARPGDESGVRVDNGDGPESTSRTQNRVDPSSEKPSLRGSLGAVAEKTESVVETAVASAEAALRNMSGLSIQSASSAVERVAESVAETAQSAVDRAAKSAVDIAKSAANDAEAAVVNAADDVKAAVVNAADNAKAAVANAATSAVESAEVAVEKVAESAVSNARTIMSNTGD
eukprot:TRINITY_DN3402_c0_g1_i1.p1 TRINITY_DN3402_c0_g1~~TRINITY_DN3402_c0_g1_i1.p1  ORF type:complete len:850 (+),score=191.91 TRINITY_DN3402_c0_g1_i1:57-2606(+)